MRFTMGGREFDLTQDEVRRRMKHSQPEPIQKHVVEVNETVFPPKQVIDECVGFPRTSFTTMEAQRVLNRLGFVCRTVGASQHRNAWIAARGDADAQSEPPVPELDSIRAALTTLQLAIAGIDKRLIALEERGN